MSVDAIVWIWAAAGMLMILAELIVPGFVICFFGVSALLVALLRSLLAIPVTVQLLLFAVFGVLLLLLCRKWFPAVFQGQHRENQADIDRDDVAGAAAVVTEKIVPPLAGKIEFRGSFWEAVGSREIAAGEIVRIVRRENLTLVVEPAPKPGAAEHSSKKEEK